MKNIIPELNTQCIPWQWCLQPVVVLLSGLQPCIGAITKVGNNFLQVLICLNKLTSKIISNREMSMKERTDRAEKEFTGSIT